jgi:diaminopropionate ammonia-lyase
MTECAINPGTRLNRSCLGLFGDDEYRLVRDFFCSLADYRPTPLVHLRALASEVGVGDILVKDESSRFGLNSFKVLGVSYAVRRLLDAGSLVRDSVLVCASEGNHGRAVAHVAAENRLGARIYVARDTSPARIEAIEKEGGQVIAVEGTYDDATTLAVREATHYGWKIISDSSWIGYEEIPRWIMAGYTKLFDEIENQLRPEGFPDVVLIQAGVGGLACAAVSWLCHRFGARRPFTIVCEPAGAACLLESVRAGESMTIHGPFTTIMAGLRCGKASRIAWPVISETVDAFVSIDDEQCASAMRALSDPSNDDPVIKAGAAGSCGLAGLLAIQTDERLSSVQRASGLTSHSRVLVINTEGATDPELYSRITD